MDDTELGRARYGWIFAAVWLFYLADNLSALLDRPDGWQRDLGLAALVGIGGLVYFAVAWVIGGIDKEAIATLRRAKKVSVE